MMKRLTIALGLGMALGTALAVHPWAQPQFVPGPGSNVNVTQWNGNTIDTNSGVKSAGTLRIVLATDQPQLTNKLLVTPDANSAVNVAQINGVATTMGNGISGTGVQRVTLASDSTGQVVLAAGSATIGALTANQSVNVAQVNGVATTMGNGVSGTGVQRVTIASDSTGVVGLNTGTNTIGSVKLTDGTTTQITDPCQGVAKTYTPISIAAATTTRIIAPTAAKKTYICSLFLWSAGTNNVGIVEGTGGTCVTGTAGVIGGTTAATGPNMTAQTAFVLGSGSSAVAATAGTNVDFCLITSGTPQLSGHVVWVAQ